MKSKELTDNDLFRELFERLQKLEKEVFLLKEQKSD